MKNFFIGLFIALGGLLCFAAGVTSGGTLRQNIIVEECKKEGVYLDRRLLILCRVNEPVEQRGSTS